MLPKIEAILAVSICLAAASLPLPITISWTVIILSMIVWGIWKLSLFSQSQKPSLALGPLSLPIFVYALAVTISGAPNTSLHDAWQSLASLRVLLLYFFAYDVFASSPSLKPIACACLLFVSSLSGLWGSIQQVFDWHPTGFKWLQGTGFQSGPMAFAGQMQIFALLALGFLFTGGYRSMPRLFQHKWIFICVCSANVSGIIFASERSAWLGFLVSFCFLTLILSSRKAMLQSFAVSFVSVLAAWLFIPVVKKRMMPLLDWQHEVSSKARFKMWDVAMELFKEKPIFGVGATRFPKIAMKDAIVPGRSEFLDHAHSNYFQVLSTTGVVGMAAYLYLCVSMLVSAWRHFKTKPVEAFCFNHVERAIGLSVLAMVISLMVSGIFEYNFGTGPVRLPMFFVLALLAKKTTP
jgi:O-antigen ligase